VEILLLVLSLHINMKYPPTTLTRREKEEGGTSLLSLFLSLTLFTPFYLYSVAFSLASSLKILDAHPRDPPSYHDMRSFCLDNSGQYEFCQLSTQLNSQTPQFSQVSLSHSLTFSPSKSNPPTKLITTSICIFL
jgi:hypothetical protein